MKKRAKATRRIIFNVALPGEDWKEAIDAAAAERGQTIAEYFRERILPAAVRKSLTPPRPAHRPVTKGTNE